MIFCCCRLANFNLLNLDLDSRLTKGFLAKEYPNHVMKTSKIVLKINLIMKYNIQDTKIA